MADNLWKKLKDGVADLTSLEVRTFTGTITGNIVAGTGGGFDWDQLIQQANTDGSTINLVASTKIAFDKDTDQFYADDITADMKEAHLTAVEASKNARLALLELAKSLI